MLHAGEAGRSMNDNSRNMDQPQRNPGVLAGVGWALLFNLIGTIVLLLFSNVLPGEVGLTYFIFVIAGIGLIQWLWLLPFARYKKRKGQEELSKGVMITGAVILLLNGTCWGMMWIGS